MVKRSARSRAATSKGKSAEKQKEGKRKWGDGGKEEKGAWGGRKGIPDKSAESPDDAIRAQSAVQ